MSGPFPTFRASMPVGESGAPRLLGWVSALHCGEETWVGDRHLGYLKSGEVLVPGRWHRAQDQWAFAPERAQDLAGLAGQQVFEVLDGYWGERAALVLGRSLSWSQQTWTEEDGDHDHCAICWEKIAVFAVPEHYRCETTGDVICTSCFEGCVRPRSLDFIPRPDRP